GIAVTNTPDVLTGDVADHAVAMWLAAARGIVGADAWVRTGRWAEARWPLQRRAFGGRAGILGLGRIGAAIAARLAGFEMEIAYAARAAKPVVFRFEPDPVALADWADVLFVATTGGAETEALVSAEVIRALGPRGMLVNIARGSVVDEEALIAALGDGGLGFAALDVFRDEPTPDPRFRTLPNVLLQPHQASATEETRRAMGALMRENVTAFFAGTPLPSPV
ncbi:MAG: NAD(P)-dependent oxidoreductase, partial [Pseudomonadota bacterium]